MSDIPTENGWCPDYRREPRTDFYCAHCQRDIKPGSDFRHVYIIEGGTKILHPSLIEAYDKSKNDRMCGYWPVGMDCAKKIGKEWVIDLRARS